MLKAEKEDKAAENTENSRLEMKMPELEIPESMKNFDVDASIETEIPAGTEYLSSWNGQRRF